MLRIKQKVTSFFEPDPKTAEIKKENVGECYSSNYNIEKHHGNFETVETDEIMHETVENEHSSLDFVVLDRINIENNETDEVIYQNFEQDQIINKCVETNQNNFIIIIIFV